MRAFKCFLLGAAALVVLNGQATDFQVGVDGPLDVVRGHALYLGIMVTNIVGTDTQMVTPSISGLPVGMTANWLTMQYSCCGTKLAALQTSDSLMLTAGSTMRTGRYRLVVRLTTDGGVERSTSFTVNVWDSFPVVPRASSFPADVPLTDLAAWQANMTTVGQQYCFASGFSYTDPWFYDGTRVFYQIADYTGSTSWNACALAQRNLYRPFVISHNGFVQGFEVFPEGLVMDYQRSGDTVSRDAAGLLFANQLYAHPTPYSWLIANGMGWLYSREISFAINSHLANERLGNPRNPDLPVLVEMLIGDFDQWFLSKRATYVQPFMVALAAESLIAYNEVTPDPRIPYLLKTAADALRANSWDSTIRGFRYENGDGTTVPIADLNLLIVPLYGWVYRYTGDVKYRTWGDEAFNGGVDYPIYSGKLFTMSYRWSGKYVDWRQKPAGF